MIPPARRSGCYNGDMAILLALISAALYGVSDYVGGRVSRRVTPLVLIAVADGATLAILASVVPLAAGPAPAVEYLAWAVAAGVSGVLGVLFLYRALADGAMTVVAPVTAVIAAALPVVVGIAGGDRPGAAALIGIGVALLAVAMISGAIGVPHVPTPRRLLVLAVAAGAGFGLLFIFYDLAGAGGTWWPLLMARAVAFPIVVGALVVTRLRAHRGRRGRRSADLDPADRDPAVEFADGSPVIDRRAVVAGLVIGLLGGSANLAYLAATQRGLLAVVAVVVSMYPATTVALATVLDHERMRRPQGIGLGLAGVALVLVTI